MTATSDNPFVRYRERLDSYAAVTTGAITEERFVEIVAELDASVSAVVGHGFVETPMIDGSALAEAAGLNVNLLIKTDAGNVGGSHKARHLFGVALQMRIDEVTGAAAATATATTEPRLAIASCGNAALGAAVVARAMDRPLDVFVPVWADEVVVAQLDELGATINRCERREGEAGDPAYLRFQEAVAAGGRPFSVQGTDTPNTFDGGRTLGWELADQITDAGVGPLDALYIQVGGGALATAVSTAMPNVRLHPVQAEGCAPLKRAWDRLAPDFDFDAAADDPDRFMEPWENPQSFATGILDDITYDWLPLLRRTHESGGHPVVAPESLIVRAYDLAHAHTDVPVCSTGASGFGGLMAEPPDADRRETVAVLFTGIDRSQPPR